MKQPDTAALRERLANYTPDDELKQDMRELEEMLQKVNCQTMELRNLLKEVNTVKDELHGIHGSLKHTVQRERLAFNALLAAKDSADNIVDGICRAIVKAEQDTVIHAKVGTDELAKLGQCTANYVKAEEELLESHRNKLAKHLRNNEGIWLSNRWLTVLIIVQYLCYLVVALWALLKI